MKCRWTIAIIAIATLSAAGDQRADGINTITSTPPFPIRGTLEVQIVGRDCRWEVTYPGRDGVLGTPDDIGTGNRWRLPAGVPIRIRLHSADFIYSLALPERNLREIAVPDMDFTLSLGSLVPGLLAFHGDEMCGDRRNELSGTVVVQSTTEWSAWLHQIEGRHD